MISEALLLAAGFSTRLRPLTKHVPKILLPFLHVRMLDMQLEFLNFHGIRSFGINVHHGKEHLLQALTPLKNVNVTPFCEEPTILGSGGGLFNMRSFGSDDNILVMNSDILCNVDLQKAYAFHQANNALVTLILVNADSSKYGSVGLDSHGKISKLRTYKTSTGVKHSGVFSGLQIVRKSLFDVPVPKGDFDLIEKVYIPLIQKSAPLYGYVDDSFWLDIGELKTYIPSHFEFLNKNPTWASNVMSGFHHSAQGVWKHTSATVSSHIPIQSPSFIGPGCVIQEGVAIQEQCILSRNVDIGKFSTLSHSLIYPGLKVEENAVIRHKILTSDLSIDLS